MAKLKYRDPSKGFIPVVQDVKVNGTSVFDEEKADIRLKTINNQSIVGEGNINVGGGGTGDYDDLTNKPSINSVTLSGNKTTSDLGLFSGDYNDLTNVPTALADFSEDEYHRTVSDTEKTNWNGKQDGLVSGTNIKTINNQSILGEGNITISGGVDSVNGQTGTVELDADDVGAYALPASGIPANQLSSEVQDTLDDVETLKQAYEALTHADIVVGSLPVSGVANVIYRVPGSTSYSDYMWDGNQFVKLAEYSITGEGIFDISVANESGGVPATYDNLTTALGDVASAVQAGGMTVRYIENVYADFLVEREDGLDSQPTGTELQSDPGTDDGIYKADSLSDFSDETALPVAVGGSEIYYLEVTGDETTYTKWTITKVTADGSEYKQYRLMADDWSLNVSDWQGADDRPADGSRNLAESKDVEYVYDLLGVDTEETITKKQIATKDYPQVYGYINPNGTGIVEYGSTYQYYVILIPLKKDETLFYDVLSGTSGMGLLGNYISASNCPVISTGTEDRVNSSYTAQGDMTLAVGFKLDHTTPSPKFYKYIREYKGAEILEGMKEDIEDMKRNLSALDITLDNDKTTEETYVSLSPEIISGKYINGNGYNSGANFSCTEWIPFKAGTRLYVKASSASSIYTIAQKSISLGVDYIYRVLSAESIDSYVDIAEDGEYAFSFTTAGGLILKELRENTVITSQRLDYIDGTISSETSDDLTENYIQDKYINYQGTVISASDWAYKEFTVRVGTKIVLTSWSTNSAICAIARKLPRGIQNPMYESLVNYTVFGGNETVEYTTTEDMTVCVCFYYTKSRSVVFSRNVVTSGDTSIDDMLERETEATNDATIKDIGIGFMFDKIAVAGDSMSVGEIEVSSEENYSPLGASWLSFLSKRWNCETRKIYANGGYDTYLWLNSADKGLGAMLADSTVCNAYFIALGHNDNRTIGDATDTAAPVTISGTTPSCPQGYSFCAYYKAIIDQIRDKAPDAMIFCMPEYDDMMVGRTATYGQKIKDIVEAYNQDGDNLIYVLETGGVDIAGFELNAHYTALGYAYMAKRVNDEVSRVIYEHRNDVEVKLFAINNLDE